MPELEQTPVTDTDADAKQALAVQAEQFEQHALVVRTRERYAAVQALRAQGKSINAIVRELGVAKETVRRFSRAASVEELLAKARDGRGRVLQDYKPYLHRRFNDGCTSASQLFREIREQGYRDSLGTVIDYLRPFRACGRGAGANVTLPAPPTPRRRRSRT